MAGAAKPWESGLTAQGPPFAGSPWPNMACVSAHTSAHPREQPELALAGTWLKGPRPVGVPRDLRMSREIYGKPGGGVLGCEHYRGGQSGVQDVFRAGRGTYGGKSSMSRLSDYVDGPTIVIFIGALTSAVGAF